jgi:hypothetical protein
VSTGLVYLDGLHVVDIDNDGDLDVSAIVRATGQVVLFRNDSSAKIFNTTPIYVSPPSGNYHARQLIWKDLKGDSLPELVVSFVDHANVSSAVVSYENNSTVGNLNIANPSVVFENLNSDMIIRMAGFALIDNDSYEDLVCTQFKDIFGIEGSSTNRGLFRSSFFLGSTTDDAQKVWLEDFGQSGVINLIAQELGNRLRVYNLQYNSVSPTRIMDQGFGTGFFTNIERYGSAADGTLSFLILTVNGEQIYVKPLISQNTFHEVIFYNGQNGGTPLGVGALIDLNQDGLLDF